MSEQDSAIGQEAKRAAAEDVLNSRTFSRSDQLKRFLRYVCDLELGGRGDEINEYLVATEALGRSAQYSPSDDSAVRSRAFALRQKLQEFYDVERPESALRILLPKGSYRPEFHLWTGKGSSGPGTTEIPRASGRRTISPALGFAAGVIITTAAGCGLFSFLKARNPAPAVAPIVRAFWGELLSPGRELTIYVACPPGLLLRSFEDVAPDPKRYLPSSPPQVSEWYQGLQLQDSAGPAYMLMNRANSLFGDAVALSATTEVLSVAGIPFLIAADRGALDVPIGGKNTVFIGSPVYSRYAASVLKGAAYTVRFDKDLNIECVTDGPGGHRFVARRNASGQYVTVYGLITVMPSAKGGDRPEKTVVFSGITGDGTRAAARFFASAASLTQLRQKFLKEGLREIPTSYQVVVRMEPERLISPQWDYETHVVLKTSPKSQEP